MSRANQNGYHGAADFAAAAITDGTISALSSTSVLESGSPSTKLPDMSLRRQAEGPRLASGSYHEDSSDKEEDSGEWTVEGDNENDSPLGCGTV